LVLPAGTVFVVVAPAALIPAPTATAPKPAATAGYYYFPRFPLFLFKIAYYCWN